MERKDDLEKNKVKKVYVLLMMLLVILFTSFESENVFNINFEKFGLSSSPYGDFFHNMKEENFKYGHPDNNDPQYTVNQIEKKNPWIELNWLVRGLPEKKQEYYTTKIEDAIEQHRNAPINIELRRIVVIKNGYLDSIGRCQVEKFNYENPES